MALQDFFNTLRFVEKKIIPDEFGGYTESYTEGAEFKGAVTTTNSTIMRIAEQQGVKSLYTVTTTKNVPLKFNDVIYSEETNGYYQITSDEMETPRSAGLDIRQFSAKKFSKEKI